MAIQAALTGHLVLSILHTNDAPSAVTRMLDLGMPAYLINSTPLGVMAQRLVRTLCPHFKKPGDPFAYVVTHPECGATGPKQLPGVPVGVAVEAWNRRFARDH